MALLAALRCASAASDDDCATLLSASSARLLYCSDIDGTAFPKVGTYAAHAWSPQQLAEGPRSLLRFVDYSIPGVNTPVRAASLR